MAANGLYSGEIAARSGTTRKALRLYEAAGILPETRRTAAGYRIYDDDALALLEFVRRARRLGFTLGEIKEIVAIKRAGRAPCPHVRDLVQRKLEELDRVREGLRDLLNGWRSGPKGRAAVCPHIEHVTRSNGRTKR